MKKRDLGERLKRRLYVNPNNGCHEFQGSRNNIGYGFIRGEKGMVTAHRAAWMLKYGSIPKDKVVIHKCSNYICCNTDHMKLGTRKEATQQMMENGRAKFGRYIIKTCEHCNNQFSPSMFMRWHGANCKHNTSINSLIMENNMETSNV